MVIMSFHLAIQVLIVTAVTSNGVLSAGDQYTPEMGLRSFQWSTFAEVVAKDINNTKMVELADEYFGVGKAEVGITFSKICPNKFYVNLQN